MKILYGLKPITSEEAAALSAHKGSGDLSPYFALCDHIFGNNHKHRKEWDCQVAYRVQHPDVKLPVLTLAATRGPVPASL